MTASGPAQFDVMIGNPPYQVPNGVSRYQVYDRFWFIGCWTAHKVAMIVPMGWQTSTGKGRSSLHHLIRSDEHLVMVDNWLEQSSSSPLLVFPNVGTGGVSIVVRDDEISSSTAALFEHGELIDPAHDFTTPTHWSPRTNEVFVKLEQWMKLHQLPSMAAQVTGRKPFAIENHELLDEASFKAAGGSYAALENGVTVVLFRDGSNSPAEAFVPRSWPRLQGIQNRSNIDRFKVAWKRRSAWANWRDLTLLEPGVIVSDAYICCFFDTRTGAENYMTYFTTLFHRFCMSETATNKDSQRKVHRFIPDLSSVTNPRTGLVGWSSDWSDADLRKLFQGTLTDDDWAYIEVTALVNDGGRR